MHREIADDQSSSVPMAYTALKKYRCISVYVPVCAVFIYMCFYDYMPTISRALTYYESLVQCTRAVYRMAAIRHGYNSRGANMHTYTANYLAEDKLGTDAVRHL